MSQANQDEWLPYSFQLWVGQPFISIGLGHSGLCLLFSRNHQSPTLYSHMEPGPGDRFQDHTMLWGTEKTTQHSLQIRVTLNFEGLH